MRPSCGVERRRLQVECATIVLYAPLARQRKSGEPDASDAHDRGQGRAPRRQHHQSRRARPRPADGHRQGSEGLRERSRPRRRSGDRRDAARHLSRPRDPSRGRHGRRRQRRRRARLDHRSARRHDQLPARLSAVLRVDRACSTRDRSRRASSTIRCATTSSPRRAAAARSSTIVACACRGASTCAIA